MDRCLIDIMLEQVKRMSKIDKNDDQAWIEMVALFKDRFGLHHDKDVLQSQSKRLEKQYRDMKDLLSQRGFWWDEMQQMVKASDDVWDAYIEVIFFYLILDVDTLTHNTHPPICGD